MGANSSCFLQFDIEQKPKCNINSPIKDNLDALELDFATKYVECAINFKEHKYPLLQYNHYLLTLFVDGIQCYFMESSKFYGFNFKKRIFSFDCETNVGGKLLFNERMDNLSKYTSDAIKSMYKLVKYHNFPMISNIDGNEKYDLSAQCLSLNKVVKSVAEKRLQELVQYSPENIAKINSEITTISENIQKSQTDIVQPHLSYVQLQDIINNTTAMQTRLDELKCVIKIAKEKENDFAKHITNLQKLIPLLITEQSTGQQCDKQVIEHVQEIVATITGITEPIPAISQSFPTI